MFILIFGLSWTSSDVQLFSDTELAEDNVENVIARRGASEGVECLESVVEVEENYLVGDGCCYLPYSTECCQRRRNRPLLAEICEEGSLYGWSFSGEKREDGAA